MLCYEVLIWMVFGYSASFQKQFCMCCGSLAVNCKCFSPAVVNMHTWMSHRAKMILGRWIHSWSVKWKQFAISSTRISRSFTRPSVILFPRQSCTLLLMRFNSLLLLHIFHIGYSLCTICQLCFILVPLSYCGVVWLHSSRIWRHLRDNCRSHCVYTVQLNIIITK